jgi:hypothetical protein
VFSGNYQACAKGGDFWDVIWYHDYGHRKWAFAYLPMNRFKEASDYFIVDISLYYGMENLAMKKFLYIPAFVLVFMVSVSLASTDYTVEPSTGPVEGGNDVVISGLPGLSYVEGLKFGTVYIEDSSNWYLTPCGTILIIVAPAHEAGTVDIAIWSDPQIIIPNAYTYGEVQPEEDLTVTPSTGPAGGGNVVIISGFSSLGDSVDVKFDENSATNVHPSDDETRLSMIAPPHAAGTVDITVWYPGLETSYIIEDAYTYASDLPSIGTAVIGASGGAYVTDTLSVTMPGGAVSSTVYLEYSPIQVPGNSAPAGKGFAGNSFSLDIYGNGSNLPDFTFDDPVTTTATYDEAIVVSNTLDASTIGLYYWSSSQGAWANDGITTVGRDTENNIVTSTITHLTDFSLLGSVLDGGNGGDGQDGGGAGAGSSGDGDGTCFISSLF